jgi:hypothetical protein
MSGQGHAKFSKQRRKQGNHQRHDRAIGVEESMNIDRSDWFDGGLTKKGKLWDSIQLTAAGMAHTAPSCDGGKN